MKTKKRFFLKAAGISPVKGAGISLALVMMFAMMFAMAFAACDTGTSSSKKPLVPGDEESEYVRPVNTPFKSADGKYVLTITTQPGKPTYYGLVDYSQAPITGKQRSHGTVTVAGSEWTFTSDKGVVFTMTASGSGESLTSGAPITADDDGATLVIPPLSLTGGSTEDKGDYTPGPTYTSEQQLRNALAANTTGGTFRITTSFALTPALGNLVVKSGQHIVVGGTYRTGENGPYSVGDVGDGPLFAETDSRNTFNIGTRLTLQSGASLTIVRGATVNATSGGELYVKTGAAVGVGVDIDGWAGGSGTGTTPGSLRAVGTGVLYFEKDATLAVTNNAAASNVRPESSGSGRIAILTDAKLAITIDTPPLANAALEADRIIGPRGNEVIWIPSGASAAINTVVVSGYEGSTITGMASGIGAAVNTAFSTATTNSPVKTTNNNTSTVIKALFSAATKSVIYSGDTKLDTTLTLTEPQTLVITGTITDQDAAINGTGTLEIAEGGSLTTTGSGAITANTLTNNGTLILGGADSTVNKSLINNGELTINAGGSALDLGADGTITGGGTITNTGTIKTAKTDGTTLKAILDKVNSGTVQVDGTVTLSANAEIKGTTTTLKVEDKLTINTGAKLTVGKDVTIDGNGTIESKGTIETAATDGDKLEALLSKATGNITATGEVTIGQDVTVQANTNLTLNEKVTIEGNGKLDLSALYVADSEQGKAGELNGQTIINSTIEVESGGTLKLPAPSLAEEVVYGTNGSVKLNTGSSADIGTIPYIGANGATAALTWTESQPDDGYVIIDNNGITLGGNGKLSHLSYGNIGEPSPLNSLQITGKVTIAEGSVLTIGPKTGVAPDASLKVDGDDELVVNGTVELYTTGYLTIKDGGKLTVGNTGTIKHTGTGKVKVSVHNGDWNAKKATVTGNQASGWNVALAASDGDAVNITLGKVKITSGSDTVVNVNLADADIAAAGKLTAGATTTEIMFLGVAE